MQKQLKKDIEAVERKVGRQIEKAKQIKMPKLSKRNILIASVVAGATLVSSAVGLAISALRRKPAQKMAIKVVNINKPALKRAKPAKLTAKKGKVTAKKTVKILKKTVRKSAKRK